MSHLVNEVVIAIDFDGTITTERDIGKELALQPYCKEVLTKWKKKGYRLILWTCRTGKALDEAMKFLAENEMLRLFDAFNDQLPEVNEKYYPDVARKVGADFYIDDRNLGAVIDWKLIERQLEEALEVE